MSAYNDRDTNMPRDHPERIISDYYSIEPNADGSVDIFMIPYGKAEKCADGIIEWIEIDHPLVVRCVWPWPGLEEHIRANYYAWCCLAQQLE